MNVALSAVEHQLKWTFAVEKVVPENLLFFAHMKISQKLTQLDDCVDFPFVCV